MKRRTRLLLLFCPLLAFGGDAGGLDYAKVLLDKQQSGFDTNVIQPVTTGSEMKSLDGSRSFDAQLTCSDSAGRSRFMTVEYTGYDNITVSADIDFDLDGSSDATWSYPDISGVCGNGVVKCDGGWDMAHCRYYQWSYDTSAGELTLKEVTGDLVNSCYCVNGACNNTALTQKKEILNTLLTSMSQTIANSRPEFVLTKTYITDEKAIGYAQSVKECTQASTGLQIGVSFGKLQGNAELEIDAQAGLGDSSAYGFMSAQQANITDNPIKAEAQAYSQDQIAYEREISQNLSVDQETMKIESYGAGDFKDSAQLADLGIRPEKKSYCKIKVIEQKSIVYSDSTISTEQKEDDAKYHIEIRECENNTCIYDNATEEILEDCAADTNNFKEAVSQLTAINEASKDMVCSSN